MKIALDPYMFRRVPLTELPGLVANLDYSCIELSPRADFLPFFLHPRADKAEIAAFKKALSAAGVEISSVLPLYRWSGPDEGERQAAVRYWERAIEMAVEFDGIATVCVFAWEERARESSRNNLEQIRKYLVKHAGLPR
jgi:myo-inositol catabolism protein IolH